MLSCFRKPLFAVFVLLLTLAACGGSAVTRTQYVLPPTPGGRQCVKQCEDGQTFCRKSCKLGQRRCVNEMQTQAIVDYQAYAREQFVAHRPVQLRPRDFERPDSCRDDECFHACERTFGACYQDCGGQKVTTSTCQLFCF